jgi:hypothetical protein
MGARTEIDQVPTGHDWCAPGVRRSDHAEAEGSQAARPGAESVGPIARVLQSIFGGPPECGELQRRYRDGSDG